MCNCINCSGKCPCSIQKLAHKYMEKAAAAASPFRRMTELAAKWADKNPNLRDRLMRALAMTGGVKKVAPNQYTVEGERGDYTVTIHGNTSTCTCKDFLQRKIHCKHRLAVALVVTARSPGDEDLLGLETLSTFLARRSQPTSQKSFPPLSRGGYHAGIQIG